MTNPVPAWIPKTIRRWTLIAWFARLGAALSCVMFANYAVNDHIWGAGFQLLCLGVNVYNIVFCTHHRRRLIAYQEFLIDMAKRKE